MKQNAEALKHYSFKRRTTIAVVGKPRGARVDLVRYVDGKAETIPLETPTQPNRSGKGGLRGMIVEKKIAKKKEEMKANMEHLTSLLHNYTSQVFDSTDSLLQKSRYPVLRSRHPRRDVSSTMDTFDYEFSGDAKSE
jgi:hypothetical protein